jgi:Tfp pilus assembly PilM family ATPase
VTQPFLAAVPPSVAIEIAGRRVSVAGIARAGGRIVVSGGAAEPLPDGAVVPALSGVNIASPDVVAEVLGRALERAGLGGTTRAALVVPDSIARVSLIPLEQIPARQADLDQLIRWQLRKSTPFPLEDAQVSQFVAAAHGKGGTVAAVVARRDVVAQYETVASRLGMHAGVVDLASFNVINAIVAAGAPAGDWLLVHLAAEATTLAIVRGDALMFYRHRTAVDEEPLRSLVHQTAMYHEDRLGGGGFAGVWVSGAGGTDADATREIADRLGVPAQSVDFRPIAPFAHDLESTAALLDALAAPVGVLVRDRAA